MTKKELEEQVKALRAKLDETQLELDEAKKVKKSEGELDDIAVGGYYDHMNREWVLVKLAYNKNTGVAKVTGQETVGPDIAMLQYNVNQFLANEVHLKNLRS